MTFYSSWATLLKRRIINLHMTFKMKDTAQTLKTCASKSVVVLQSDAICRSE